MKLSCDMFWDLYPLYEDDAVMEETKEAIHEHLEECVECSNKINEFNQDTKDIEEAVPLHLEHNVISEKRAIRSLFKKYHRTIIVNFGLVVAILIAIMALVLYFSREEIWAMQVMGKLELVQEAKGKAGTASVYYEKETGIYWIEAPNLHVRDSKKYELYWNDNGTLLTMFYKDRYIEDDLVWKIRISDYEEEWDYINSYNVSEGEVLENFTNELGYEAKGEVSVEFDRWLDDTTHQLTFKLVEADGTVHVKNEQIVLDKINFAE